MKNNFWRDDNTEEASQENRGVFSTTYKGLNRSETPAALKSKEQPDFLPNKQAHVL